MMVEAGNMQERYLYEFNVNFNVFFKIKKVHLLVSELHTFRFTYSVHLLHIAKHLPIMTVKTFLIQTNPGSYS